MLRAVFFYTSSRKMLSYVSRACVEKYTVLENDSNTVTCCRHDKVSALYRMKIHSALKEYWSIFLYVLSEYTFKMSRDSPPYVW